MSTLLHYLFKLKRALSITMLSLTVMSCGGGGSTIVTGGISGTGIVFGVLTGFGSIYVNGVRYDIDDANFEVDGVTYAGMAGQDNLSIGMVVRLQATNNGDGTGVATQVFYDDAIEGPISGIVADPINSARKTITVLGQDIIIDDTSTSFAGGSVFDFANIAVDDVVEVSGFVDQNAVINATRVEYKGAFTGSTEIEIRGTVENLVTDQFNLNGLTVFFTNAELEDLDNGLGNGVFVEVKGIYMGGNSIDAEKIEGEDDDIAFIEDSSGELSLQGIITDFTSTSSFSVNQIPVQLDTSDIPPALLAQLALGLEIEVEGEIQNGVLVADEIELRDGELEYQAIIKGKYPATNEIGLGLPDTVGEIRMTVDNSSQLEDETNSLPLIFDQLGVGEEVKVQALLDATNAKKVVTLKRRDIEKYEFSGMVTAYVQGVSVTIDGLLLELEGGAASYDFAGNGVVVDQTIMEVEDELKDESFESIEIKD